jgi:hypothetical protein
MAVNRLNGVAVLFALLIGALVGGIAVYKFKPLPEGKVIANQTAIDSLNAFIAFVDSLENLSMEPVVIEAETIIIEVPKYITTTPELDPEVLGSTLVYRDSLLVEDEISAWVNIMVKGHVEEISLNWKYIPVTKLITTTTERPVFKPIITTITKDVVKYPTGHYLSAAMGGNAKLFTFGIDYTIVKKGHLYGFEYRRYGEDNVYGFQVGINLRTLFKF